VDFCRSFGSPLNGLWTALDNTESWLLAASGTLKADTGWLRPFNSRLPRSSTGTAFSTAAATRPLIKI
jgi:hypothetical protein